jgi:2-dehydro-3-deoxyphosphogluconate aldolase/(4S)-4-hydroxy-2-oxoglutarate aldolase
MDLKYASLREKALWLTKRTGVLPAIKMKQQEDLRPFVRAMYEGGARVVEITMTTPGVLESFRALSAEFGDDMLFAAGTVLTAPAALAAISSGARIIVSPALVPEVIETAHAYGAACYAGGFTATECLGAMRAGADMIKIFPAKLGGPSYMTNLRMVFPEANLIPSGGISKETAGQYIQCGAAAVSGARNFFHREMVEREGLGWIKQQTAEYIRIVAEARAAAKPLP